MKLTVITPTFNAADCIAGCIESVARQTHRPIEHIIVDGVSKDETVEIARSYAARNPHLVVVSEKDRGIYDAMNKGLARATGDYVFFLGSDDRFYDDTVVERVFKAIGEQRPGVVYGDVLAIGDGLVPKGTKNGEIYGGEFDLNKLLQRNICHQAIFYSKAMVAKAGPYEIRYRYFADWDYNLRCRSLGDFRHVDILMARYNTNGRSSGGEDLAFHAGFFDGVKKYFGISVFDPRFKNEYGYVGFAGKLKLRQKDWHGLLYLLAACWHSPKYLGELFGTLLPRRRGSL